MNQIVFMKKLFTGRAFLCGGMIVALPAMQAIAQEPPPSKENKPAPKAELLLPPLPRVKGTIAKAPDTWDGKVVGLNAEVYDAYDAIIRNNPGALTAKNAMTLREAVIKDDQIDAAEADLLAEMTQSQFRSITITKVGAAANASKLTRYPCSGLSKTILSQTLHPALDLTAAWSNGSAGWQEMVLESRKNQTEEQRVATFLEARVSEAWETSNQGNGYKPFRDMLSKRYGYTKAAGFPASHAASARKLMIDACTSVDRKSGDKMPDFLYTWWTASAFQ